MATKKKVPTKLLKRKKEEKSDFLKGWSDVISASGDRMRERSNQIRADNKARADAIKDLPLEDIFHEVATQTTVSPAALLRELIAEGPQTGLRECPDALTTALVRAAHFWYVAANTRVNFGQKTHWRCLRSDASGMTASGRWRCTKLVAEMRRGWSGMPVRGPDQVRPDIFDNLDKLLLVLETAIQYKAGEGGEDVP